MFTVRHTDKQTDSDWDKRRKAATGYNHNEEEEDTTYEQLNDGAGQSVITRTSQDRARREVSVYGKQLDNKQALHRLAGTMDAVEVLFNHSAGLIVQHGTMIDRIDYQMDKTNEGLGKGLNILKIVSRLQSHDAVKQIEHRQRTGLVNHISMALLLINLVLVGGV